ncbi:hypothetical protein NUW54_g8047 [Trametes sanguinea]|uniref:Uncharacterized protein n=1 Tax=Trametes sanguinea TaxID=158606 RepID=A0ACC1PIY7_9APHY|nr:hypothetical protein NUW54_g8047 [Trametes sanguinea]
MLFLLIIALLRSLARGVFPDGADVEKAKLVAANKSSSMMEPLSELWYSHALHLVMSSSGHALKKLRASQQHPALVQNWETRIQDTPSAPSESVLAVTAQDVHGQRASSVVSSLVAADDDVPPSSSAGSVTSDSDDHQFLDDHSIPDDGDTLEHELADDSGSVPMNLTASECFEPSVVRYRKSIGPNPAAREPEPASVAVPRPVSSVTDILTKVIPRTSTPALKAASNSKRASFLEASTVKISATVKSEKMRTAGRKSERTATSGKALKSKISDLAPALREPFNRRFVPLVRQFLGTRKPWQDATLVELQQLHRKAFGQELSDQYPLEERDHCFKLIHYRMDDWHSKFGSTAIATFEEIIKALRSGDDVASDGFTSQLEEEHDNPFSSPQGIGMYANWLLGDARKAAPFYWKRWNSSQDREGRLQSDIIVGTFAYHLAEILALDPEERIMEYPVGALTLATLGAQHASVTTEAGGASVSGLHPNSKVLRWADATRMHLGCILLARDA